MNFTTRLAKFLLWGSSSVLTGLTLLAGFRGNWSQAIPYALVCTIGFYYGWGFWRE